MKKAAFLFCASIFLALPALADGLQYTTRSPALQQDQSTELRTLTYAHPDATPVKDPHVTEQGAKTDAPETPSDQVWEKYKSLASGEAQQEAPIAPAPQAQAPAPATTPAPAAPIGLAGILQEYQKTKAERSDMHTLVITPPAEAEKIEAATEKKREEFSRIEPAATQVPIAPGNGG